MKKLAIALCFALSACAGQSAPQVAAIATPYILPVEQVRDIQVMCVHTGEVLEAAARPTNPEIVVRTAEDAAAYCRQLLAGRVPPTTDRNTKNWLSRVLDALPAVTQAAGILLR